MENTTRRSFVKSMGATAIAVAAQPTQLHAAEPSNKLVVAVIGTGGMGNNHLKTLCAREDVHVAYVCDVDTDRLAAASGTVQAITGKAAKAVGDLRRILEDPQVDAVYIATPDHWHAPAAILALNAGKHVYVEKPCCHNIREGRLMIEAAKKNGKVAQVGTQSRSAPFLKDAIQRLHSGEIGKVLVAKAWNSQRRSSIGKVRPSEPPANLDFDTWLGPAPKAPYRSNLLPANWRWWYDFGCGDIGNDGVHDIDVALWGLNVKTHPIRVSSFGRKNFFDDDQQFPDTQYAVCDYPIKGLPEGRVQQLIFEQRIWSPYVQEGYENGVAFYGTRGMLLVGHSKGWRLYGERNKLISEATGTPKLDDHYNNFFACIRGEAKTPNASLEIGHRAATICHLANTSARVGRTLTFDPASEQIVGDEQAKAMAVGRYRDGHWAVPLVIN